MFLNIFVVNIQINYHNLTNPLTVSLSIVCQSLYANYNEIRFELTLKKIRGDIVNTTIVPCFTEFQYHSLEYLTTYELVMYWITSNGTMCNVIKKGTNVFTTGPSPPLSQAAVAGIVFAIMMPSLILLCCIFFFYIFLFTYR